MNSSKTDIDNGLSGTASIETQIHSWISQAKTLWLRRIRPDDATVIADFTGGEFETGEWLVTFREFEIRPEQVRQLSSSYYFLSVERMDFFLFSFLRGNLLDGLQADVSIELAAKHIVCNRAESLTNRFSLAELCCIQDYFRLSAELRGRALEVEKSALRMVHDSINEYGAEGSTTNTNG